MSNTMQNPGPSAKLKFIVYKSNGLSNTFYYNCNCSWMFLASLVSIPLELIAVDILVDTILTYTLYIVDKQLLSLMDLTRFLQK